MTKLNDRTVREIVQSTPTATIAFEEFNIDYYCAGNRSFDDACRIAGVDSGVVSRRIEEERANTNMIGDFAEQKTASGLVEYIVERHHTFTKEESKRISTLFVEVCRTHSSDHPELLDLQNVFKTLCNDLLTHMQNEETVLFPYVKDLEAGLLDGVSALPIRFESVKNQSRMLRLEHEESVNILRKMRKVSADYQLPEAATSEMCELYSGILGLERDLHYHIHLENNLLFPLAAKIEEAGNADL